MAVYKLTYFDIRGKGEIIRLIFAAAGVEYEDVRLDYAAWKESPIASIKDALPFGQIPTLTVDGAVYCQSVSIARYLAEKFDLAGRTPEERLRADMIVMSVEDVLNQIIVYRHSPVKEEQERLVKRFKEEQLPQSCANFERFLTQNGGGDGYLVGNRLTWADITLYYHLTGFLPMGGIEPAYLDAYPKLKGLIARVGANPGIAAWEAKRPVTAI
jgi:glutathione S-transferase